MIEAALTARALGLGEHIGRHAPFLRSVRRAVDYDLIGLGENDEALGASEVTLLVRQVLPPLSDRLADRLPQAPLLSIAATARPSTPTNRHCSATSDNSRVHASSSRVGARGTHTSTEEQTNRLGSTP